MPCGSRCPVCLLPPGGVLLPAFMHARLDCCLCLRRPSCLASLPPAVARLEQQALKSSIDPLYQQVKSYICCRLSNGTYDVWVAWTVAGVLGFLLALMCSVRIAHHTLSMRKYQVGGRAGWVGGAAGAACVRVRLEEQAALKTHCYACVPAVQRQAAVAAAAAANYPGAAGAAQGKGGLALEAGQAAAADSGSSPGGSLDAPSPEHL